MKLYNVEEKDYLLYFCKEILQINHCLMVPVYSVFDDKEILFPITLAFLSASSNGMCAGNSNKESILQGFCEIFERYAAAEIYYKNLTPPTIPLDEFKNTPVYEKAKYIIDKMGYNLIIKG
jgi:ribosomal protein S12 methylthiotransferase accessory factor